MNGRILRAALLLLVLLTACFATAPVFSGEHPWDSDRGPGGDGDVGLPGDTLVDLPDSVYNDNPDSGDDTYASSLGDALTAVWSAVLVAF